jgi:hypothetical protein
VRSASSIIACFAHRNALSEKLYAHTLTVSSVMLKVDLVELSLILIASPRDVALTERRLHALDTVRGLFRCLIQRYGGKIQILIPRGGGLEEFPHTATQAFVLANNLSDSSPWRNNLA